MNQNELKEAASMNEHNKLMFTTKINRTTYDVEVYFSQASTETMSDKILRLLETEINQ